jgi:outer membrane protein assembly factor BamA
MQRLFLVIYLISFKLVLSQKKHELTFSDDNYKLVKKNVQRYFKDSAAVTPYLLELKKLAIKSGYLLTSIDSLHYNNATTTCFFYVGPKFKKTKLFLSPEQEKFLKRKGGVNEKLIRNIAFSPREINRFLNSILTTYVNNGFPFASVKLKQIDIINEVLHAEIEIKTHQQKKIEKINLVGEPLISEKFIYSLIQIKPGDYFNQEKINLIASALKKITFIEEIKPTELLFTETGVELYLYLKSKPVSLINGVVGLQQVQQTNLLNSNEQRYFLNGELRLKLVNTLRKAELFDLDWRSIQAQTQALKVNVNLPNLFQTAFGLDGHFQLYKRDSTFLELKSTFGVQYAFNNGNFLKLFYRRNSSNVLSGGKNNPLFSNLKSVESDFYGIGFLKQTLDYLPNPRKGYQVLAEATIGTRTTKDTIKLKEMTSKIELQFSYYFPLAKRHVLKLSNYSESYFAPTFFENEVYRFGGQISLRGFNEEELYATSRSVSSIEYRFLLDQNSFLFLFFDQAWYENKAKQFITDTPYGFGGGFSFGTAIGNFAVSYALGKQLSNKISTRDGKVHFGYIAYF